MLVVATWQCRQVLRRVCEHLAAVACPFLNSPLSKQSLMWSLRRPTATTTAAPPAAATRVGCSEECSSLVISPACQQPSVAVASAPAHMLWTALPLPTPPALCWPPRVSTGDLLLCDGCPSVYHPRCCGLRGVPSGDWFCPVCSDGRTPSHQRRARQRRQLQRSTAKTGAGGRVGGGAGEAAQRQGGSRLAQPQAQQQKAPKGSSGGSGGQEDKEEEVWEDWGAAGSTGGGGDTPSWDLL